MPIQWGDLPPPPEEPPEFDVWLHLSGGLDYARDELRALHPLTRAVAEAIAKHVVGTREKLVAPPQSEDFLALADGLLQDPWFKHAADIELAEIALGRAIEALKRYTELKPILTRYELPDRAQPYVRELTGTFIFGFDAPAIAFAGAALEQILKDVLVQIGEYTEARMRRERPTGERLLATAKSRGVVRESEADAKHLFEQRNRTLHRHVWEEKIIKSVALDCISRFATVVQEIGTHEQA